MDESEDQEGKEAGANSAGCDVPKEARSLVTSDQNDLDNKEEDELGEQVEEEEEEKLEDYPNDEAGPSEHREDKDDGNSTIQPVVGEANGKPAFHDGREGTEPDVHKETEKDEKQSHKGDDDENKVDKGETETREEPRLNEKLEDESGKDGKEKEKASETEEPEEVEMKDLSEHLDVPEDGEIVEESQASTSQDQDVSVSQGDVVLEEAVTTEEVVEVKTLEEAKERIGVLEKRIEKEIKHRLDLVKQVKSLSQELHKLKGGSSLETHAVGVQTDPECIQIYDEQPPTQQAEVYQVVDSSSSMQQGASTAGQTQWPARTQGPSSSSSTAQVQSVAESVRATAEAALAQSGVVLDEASGMYYDYNSGYYYDPNNHLYYDPARGIYYYYDEQTQSYQFHSKIDLPEVVVGGTGSSRSQLDGRRHERDRRKGDRARRRRNHNDQSRDELGTSERPSTSRRTGNTECEVIDITSPAEDYPENGMDTTTSATTTTTTKTTKSQDAFRDQNDGIDIVEIVDDDDSLRRRHRRRSRSSHSRRKRRKMGSEEERKENGEDLPDVIVIDSEESDMEEGELSDSSSESGGSSKGESGDDAEGDDVSEESMVIDDDDDVQSVEATKVDFPPCVRMIVVRSESMKLGSLSIVTCTGGTIGREGSNHILLVPELGVSKTHAQMSYDAEKKFYTITDLGSQNGTVLNGVPLTKKSRVKSDPQLLSHKDYLTFGTTTLRIHIHKGDETCDECEPGQVQAAFRHQQSMEVTPVLSQADKEQQRRKELRKIKKKYLLAGADYSQREPSRAHPGYKDRAEERRVTVGSDNPYQSDDMPASVDRAISGDNMGHKMLKKMGWKEGQSLGKNESGIKEPIQVFLHSKKSGLGAGSQKSMNSLDLIGKRKSENWERARDRYHHLDQGTSSSSPSTSHRQPSRPQEMKWVKGATQVDDSQNSVPRKEDDGDVEVVGADKETGAVAKDTSNSVCDVDMDGGESKEDGKGSDGRTESTSGEGSTKKSGIVEEMTADGTAKEAPSALGDGSKTTPSSSNNVTAGIDATENESSTSLESESTSKSDSHNQADGTNTKQTQLESKTGKDNSTDKSTLSNSLSHKGEQNSVEVPVEREAAKKPIRFVIPPRMNSKGDSGKTPLTASRSVSENNGEGPSTRRTRQSSRRGKEKRDNIDMFDNG